MSSLLLFTLFPTLKDPVTYAVPFFVILILVEAFISAREQTEIYEAKDTTASLSMGIGSVVINIFMKALALLFFNWIYQFHLFDIKAGFISFLVLFFLDDFTFYWFHRSNHEVRVLWAAHVNHHSSQKYNLSTALRQSWGEQIYKYIYWAWLPLLGFEPLWVMIMISISLIYQFWIHTQFIRKFPAFVEFVFNTPSHHRVHHAVNIPYLDKNHGGILIIWDRLFGTFAEESDEQPVFGITSNIHTFNPLRIATHEYANIFNDIKNATTFKDKMNYLLKPPGWSHTGQHTTAKALQGLE